MITHTRVPPSRRPPAPTWIVRAMIFLVTAAAASRPGAQAPVPPPPSSTQPESATGPQVGAAEYVYCPVCGARNRAGSRFCLKDGTPLPDLDPARVRQRFVRDPATYSEEEVQQAVHRASQSVVRVRVKGIEALKIPVARKQQYARLWIGELVSLEGESRLVGSGFVIGPGEIVTNAHVASPFSAPGQIAVETQDGRSILARLQGVDRASDLALVKIDVSYLPTIEWGDSERLRLGDETWAIGNPLDLGISVTRGTIATLARMRPGMNQVEAFLHSDAFITHGNSGGPLVDALGSVVGVSDMGFEEERGQGYSIPSTMARLVIDRLRKYGKYERGYLGLHVRQVDAASVAKYGLKRKVGVLVESVLKGTPAESAGFRTGDVLFGINGRQAVSSYLLQEAVSSVGPGAQTSIALDREGQVLEIKVATALRPEAPRIDPVIDLQGYLTARFEEASNGRGVVVRIPDKFSPAARFGFQDGDIVASVLPAMDWPKEPITFDIYRKTARKVSVDGLDDLRAALARMHMSGRVGVVFEVKRAGQPIAVAYDEVWPIVL